jgi:alkyl sulfatase BDS1-like metallo-beta-lactamase superfamily hydrolase
MADASPARTDPSYRSVPGDPADFEDAGRGFIAALAPGVVRGTNGQVVWDSEAYAFLDGECPDTAHPSLWRQGQLCARRGLFQVTERVYQVRGLDLSNMTLVEGDRGVIVIDPLISVETATAALELYRSHRGDRPVTSVIYTHSHGDHFGGGRGVLGDNPDRVPIVAPEGFLAHAVAENVYAGPAMARRGTYMYGPNLEPGPAGQIGCGLGLGTSHGTISLLPPTVDITHTGQELVLDGVRFVFQTTPGTEAPAEMNFLLPDLRALCVAENATHNLHNILTLRGALVRDALLWSRYLDEAIGIFAGEADVAFASHHWPTWGRDRIVTFLAGQRDLYAYLHDQTLRLMNQGFTGIEIAEQLEAQLPPALRAAAHTHGYYGSVSHNVKAIYQRYLGWFDGHPSSLWELPPEQSAARYVEALGGVAATLDQARRHAESGDLRFAAQLLKHAVFAQPHDKEAKELLAGVYERLAYGAENATWRNFYLSGAQELRTGVHKTPLEVTGPDVLAALTVTQVFDTIASRVNGPRAWAERLVILWNITDVGERHRMALSNGALIHREISGDPAAGAGAAADHPADLTLTLTRSQILGLMAGHQPEGIVHTGDLGVLGRLSNLLDQPDPNFAIVIP